MLKVKVWEIIMSKKPIRLSLDVSEELNSVLDDMAEKTHSSKSEVLRKSIALMKVAVDETEKGNHVGIIKNQQVIKEIVNL